MNKLTISQVKIDHDGKNRAKDKHLFFSLKQTNKYKHKKQFKILLVCNGEQTSTEWFQVLLKLFYETSIVIIDSLFDLNSISDV